MEGMTTHNIPVKILDDGKDGVALRAHTTIDFCARTSRRGKSAKEGDSKENKTSEEHNGWLRYKWYGQATGVLLASRVREL